jgi:hypothetical protein
MVSRVGFRWTWEGEGRRLCAEAVRCGGSSCGQAAHGGFRGSVGRVIGGELRGGIYENQRLVALLAHGLRPTFQVIRLGYQPFRVHEIKLDLTIHREVSGARERAIA